MYVSPDGTATGEGTLIDPMSMNAALTRTGLAPLPFVLRGGTYHGPFTVTRTATFKAYPGENVKIDGWFFVNAANCTFDGLELFSTAWTTRQSTISGSAPSDIPVWEGFTLNATGTTIRNCVIHDCRQGIISKKDGATVQDCLFYNNGWLGPFPERGHGHALYAQQNVIAPLTIERCVFGTGYSDWGIHAYSGDGQTESHITARDNVHVGKVALFYSQAGMSDDITIIGNETWRGKLEVGQSSNDHHVIAIEDNYLIGAGAWQAMVTRRLKDCIVQHNTIIATDGQLLSYVTPNTDPPINQVWSTNEYHGQGVFDETITRTWEAWRSKYGLDADSMRVDSAPTINRIRVINDRIVVVYNWEGLASVSAPKAGRYTNCQNPVESVVLAAGDPLPMTGWTVATPYAAAAPLANWDSRFGVFLVEDL